jgi:hypothetical protein
VVNAPAAFDPPCFFLASPLSPPLPHSHRYEKYVLTRDDDRGGGDAFAAAHADVLVKVAALAAKADEAAAAGDRATRAALNAEIR